MVSLSLSREIFNKIYPNQALIESLEKFIFKHNSTIKICLNFCTKGRWELFLKASPFFKLALVYAFLPEIWHKYNEKGINEKIFFDTMDDIKIWINDYYEKTGKYGLDELNWIMNHMNMKIFKLGRLQFQLFAYCFSSEYRKNGTEIHFGDKVLNIHIPRGEKLDIVQCKNSVIKAVDFFNKYYPEYSGNNFICISWLLYPGNINYMDENSNIIQFTKMFDIIDISNTPAPTFRWLFKKEVKNSTLLKSYKKHGTYYNTNELPLKTSLQIKAANYINNGGTFGEGKGILIR